jgi:hypothetical protein
VENGGHYWRQRSKRSVYERRRSWAIFALFLAMVSVSVLISAWRVAYADGPGTGIPSSAASSAPPAIQRVPDASTGVYLGCQELAPASELPQSSR